jgi:hypothetical protein
MSLPTAPVVEEVVGVLTGEEPIVEISLTAGKTLAMESTATDRADAVGTQLLV